MPATTQRPARGVAFSLMLRVKRELVRNMLTYGEGRFTILESSEDAAADVIDKALKNAKKRGARNRS